MNFPDLQLGADAGRNWVLINQAFAYLRLREKDERRGREAIEAIRRSDKRTPLPSYPFRVYLIPNSRRILPDPDWWRKFTVQHGYVNYVKTDACDDADGEGTSALPIDVPAGADAYYIWVESSWDGSQVTANTIQSGDSPWPGYPISSQGPKINTLLARIDTLTNLASLQAIVRQFVYEDIIIADAGGGANPYLLTAIKDNHLLCQPMTGGDSGNALVPDESAEAVYIAKPHDLRKKGWDGQTIDGFKYSWPGADSAERKSAFDNGNGTSTVETQVIIPPYLEGFSIIYADSVPAMGLQVETDPGPPPAMQDITLLDQNRGARAWGIKFGTSETIVPN